MSVFPKYVVLKPEHSSNVIELILLHELRHTHLDISSLICLGCHQNLCLMSVFPPPLICHIPLMISVI